MLTEAETTNFLLNLSNGSFKMVDRAVGLIWLGSQEDPGSSLEMTAITQSLYSAGYPKQNITRLRDALKKDPRTSNGSKDSFRIRATARIDVDRTFQFAAKRQIPISTNAILPEELFSGTRPYLEKVVHQINASYIYKLYDCTSVMCRRLIETLLIEAYEATGNDQHIKDSQENYKMLSGIISDLESNKRLPLGRDGIRGVKNFKTFGDISAHNRYCNALQTDIDKITVEFRIACEELLHIARLT